MRLLFITTLFMGFVNAKAQQTVLTTAVPYLRIGSDSRAGGMGDAGVTSMADANNIYWNNAKSLFATNRASIGLNYTSWFREVGAKDIYLLTIGGYKQLNEKESISGGIRYFSQGTIQMTSINGDLLSQFKPRDFDLNFGYSRKLNEKLGVGVTSRFISSNLSAGNTAGLNSSTLAGDLSLLYNGLNENGQGWRWGMNISNLGGKMGLSNTATTSKDYLPANLAVSCTYTKVFDEKNQISLSLDVNKLLVPLFPSFTGNASIDSSALSNYRSKSVVSSWFDSFNEAGGVLKSLSYSIGMEYRYEQLFSARIGYYTEDMLRGNRKFLTTGVGLHYKNMGLHLSYLVVTANSNRNVLANTIRLGLVFE